MYIIFWRFRNTDLKWEQRNSIFQILYYCKYCQKLIKYIKLDCPAYIFISAPIWEYDFWSGENVCLYQ